MKIQPIVSSQTLIVDEELLILDADGRRQPFSGQGLRDYRLHRLCDPGRQTPADLAGPALFLASCLRQTLAIAPDQIGRNRPNVVGQIHILRKTANDLIGF